MCLGVKMGLLVPIPHVFLTPPPHVYLRFSFLLKDWIIPAGGFDYNCFDFVNGASLPGAKDDPDTCVQKMQKLQQQFSQRPASPVVLYGDRTHGSGYDDSSTAQAVAVFMLLRHEHWWFGLPATDTYNATAAKYFLTDYGAPTSNMTQQGSVFSRPYQHATVSLDCSKFQATFDC